MAPRRGEDPDGVRSSLVDDFGRHIGRAMGWPPMAGRAAGVLLLSEGPLTLTDLQHALGASKGSVSEITRLLVLNGTVERYKPAGTRHFVFRWRDDAWVGCLRHQLDQTTQLLALAADAEQRGAGLPATQRARLRRMHDHYRFMADQLHTLLAGYPRHQQVDRSAPADGSPVTS